jgi:hypothetical protein
MRLILKIKSCIFVSNKHYFGYFLTPVKSPNQKKTVLPNTGIDELSERNEITWKNAFGFEVE